MSIKEISELRKKEKRLIQQSKLAVEEMTMRDAVTSSPRQFDRSFSSFLRETLSSDLDSCPTILPDFHNFCKVQQK